MHESVWNDVDTEDQSTQRNLSQSQLVHHKYHTDQNQIQASTEFLLHVQFDKNIYWISGVKRHVKYFMMRN